MKKTLLILFLILINFNLFAQNKRLDEIISNNFKIHFNYDSSNKYLGAQFLSLNADGINWDLQEEINVLYNADNLVSTEISSEWNGSTLINDGKYEYAYDTAQNIISETEYDWNNTTYNWETLSNTTYIYDNENLITKISEDIKTIYTYDASNKLILRENFSWDDANNTWHTQSGVKYEFVFNNNTLHKEQFIFSEDVWNCEEKTDYTYNTIFSENNLILPFNKGALRSIFITSYTDMITKLEVFNCAGSSNGLYTYQYTEIALSVTNNELVEINIYPNPTSNQVKFEIDNYENIKIYDINGKQMINTKSNIIDCENLSKGVYFYKIFRKKEILTGKLMKK